MLVFKPLQKAFSRGRSSSSSFAPQKSSITATTGPNFEDFAANFMLLHLLHR